MMRLLLWIFCSISRRHSSLSRSPLVFDHVDVHGKVGDNDKIQQAVAIYVGGAEKTVVAQARAMSSRCLVRPLCPSRTMIR